MFGEDKIDILDLVTTPSIEPKDRFQIMRNIVEPIYLDLYQKDLEEEKKKGGKKDSGQGGESGPSNQPPQEGKSGQADKKDTGKDKAEKIKIITINSIRYLVVTAMLDIFWSS